VGSPLHHGRVDPLLPFGDVGRKGNSRKNEISGGGDLGRRRRPPERAKREEEKG